ncbi:MAG: hypothetical protein ACE5GS_00900 [Kiloniellaceae bacterium]
MKLSKYLMTVGALAAVTIGLSAPRPAAAEAQHKWRMATSWGGGPLMELGAKVFADRINFLTEGRIEVEVFPGGTLGKALKVSERVKNGVAEVGHT